MPKIVKDIIRVDSLVKILGNRVILYDVNFEVKQGEIFGLIGASGSGKTTLLRSLVGFFKPEKGDVLIRSAYVPHRQYELYTSVTKHSEDIKRTFGFASQHPSIYMDLTVEENLDYFASLHGIPVEERRKTADILLTLMDLQHSRTKLGKFLSGGMQRRLDIACAMIHRPKILILDEPTADLDPFLRKHIWDMIKKINQQGTTVIVSSHNMPDVEMICDRIGVVHHGKIIAIDTPEKIKRKFTATEEIRVQTYPGRYERIQRHLTHSSIQDVEVEGQELVLTTTNAEETLKVLIAAVQKTRESLTSINVAAGSLDEVFIRLAEDEI